MKIAVTGSMGLIGSELLKRGAYPIISNVLDRDILSAEIKELSPDVIVHCAAITDVAFCEQNKKAAFDVNVKGISNVIDGFSGHVIYLSTDHVFSGDIKKGGYKETDVPKPTNQYGATKWVGEIVSGYGLATSHIIRTSKVFNYAKLKDTLSSLIVDGEFVEFSDVLYRSYIHVAHFVDSLLLYVDKIDNLPHLMNLAGRDVITEYHFWSMIANEFAINQIRIMKRDYPLEGGLPRPLHGGLDVSLAREHGIEVNSAWDGVKLSCEEFKKARDL